MRRDVWVTLAGICIAGLTLAWILSSGGTDADASEEKEDGKAEENEVGTDIDEVFRVGISHCLEDLLIEVDNELVFNVAADILAKI